VNSHYSKDNSLPAQARQLLWWVSAIGSAVTVSALFQWRGGDVRSLLVWTLAAAVSGACKFRVPGIESSFSLGYIVVLGAIGFLPFPETVAVSILTVLAQCYWRKGRPRHVQVLFNVFNYAISSASAWYTFHELGRLASVLDMPARFAIAGAVFFISNTALVSWIVSIVSAREFWNTWENSFLVIVPYYLVGVGAAGALTWRSNMSMCITIVLILAVAYSSMRLWVRKACA